MKIEQDHIHENQSSNQERKHKRLTPFDSGAAIKNYFADALSKSQSKMNQESIDVLNKIRQLRQKRIYAGMEISQLEYLFILFQDRRLNLGLQAEAMEQIIINKNDNVHKDIVKNRLSIEMGKKKTHQIRKQLDSSLGVLRNSSPIGSISSKSNNGSSMGMVQSRMKIEQFKKKSYWKVPNEKSQSVQAFIKLMRQRQKQQRKRYRSKVKRQKSQFKLSQDSKAQKKQQRCQKLKEQLHQQFLKKKQQKDRDQQENQKKKEEIDEFLNKFRQKPPNYIIFSDRYKKKEGEEQKQRKQFLRQLKQARRHNSLDEMRQQMIKYDEAKQLHEAERLQQRRLQQQIQEQIRQKQRDLYHSKLHSRSLRERPPQVDHKIQKQKQMLKMIMYSKKAQMEHSPQVDQEKRFELIKDVSMLKKRQDHNNIIKTRNGEQIVINRSKLDPRKIGLEYLEEVKQMTSQIERKPPPTPPSKEQKILDRSLLPTSFYNKKITITNWKQIMENKNFSGEQKEDKLKQYFDLIEEKQLQSIKQSKKSDLQRSLSIQKMIDHYEIQKTQAKLALLKSFT